MNRRSIVGLVVTTVLGLVFFPGSAISQQKSIKDQLIGAWALVSFNATAADGTKRQDFGANPKGILILEAGGRYALVQGRPDRPKFKGDNDLRLETPAAEFGEAARAFAANFGTWSVNEADKTLVLRLEGNLIPNAEGTGTEVAVSLAGDELKLTGGTGRYEAVYRRAKSAAPAQQPDRMRRVAVLSSQGMGSPTERVYLETLRQELDRLGWVEGRNLQIDVRYSGARLGRAQAIAEELVALRPDVILGESTPYVRLLKQGGGSIPIVFMSVSDPVGSGFVESLARPGGNLTGFLLFEGSITGKWLGMLKEIAPQLERAAFIADPNGTPYDYFLQAAKQAASTLGIDLTPYRVGNAEEVERTIEAIAREPNSGLLFPPDNSTGYWGDLILRLAAKYRLPAVFSEGEMVKAGGLMAYYTDRRDQYRLAAGYVDRILRGGKPADLPVQAPVKYVTILNLRTAEALGLAVPQSILLRADEVIE
jgi:putative ABC transport system substrate-binding protein